MNAGTCIDLDEEASALGETVDAPPPPLPSRWLARTQAETCESLWLPACPVCSWIELWRRPSLDRMEYPGFAQAQHCTAHWGKPYYMLRGCPHATEVGIKAGPVVNRLKVAVTWRRHAAELGATMYPEQRRYSPELRRAFLARFDHPSTQIPSSL